MSRPVAGFAILLYVCAVPVTGQLNPGLRLKGTNTPDDPSIAIGEISGGNYPAGSFSIGYGDNNEDVDGVLESDDEWNVGNIVFNGGNGQNGGEYVNGQNDISNYPGQNNVVDQYVEKIDNPGQKSAIPNDNSNKHATTKVPAKNSAWRSSFFSDLLHYILSWF